MGRRLYVGNLPYGINEDEIRSFFGDGNQGVQVTDVRVITDRDTGRSRGFAFVEMSKDEDAQEAIGRLHGQQLGGRRVVVNEAREPPRNERGGGGGRREGGGRGRDDRSRD